MIGQHTPLALARVCAWLLGLAVALVPLRAWSVAPRWSAAACRARTVSPRDRAAQATLDSATGAIRVWVYDTSTDAVVAERTVVGPSWRSRVGEECRAMGIAGAEIARTPARRLAVRLEVSVSDLCERRAPACAVVELR